MSQPADNFQSRNVEDSYDMVGNEDSDGDTNGVRLSITRNDSQNFVLLDRRGLEQGTATAHESQLAFEYDDSDGESSVATCNSLRRPEDDPALSSEEEDEVVDDAGVEQKQAVEIARTERIKELTRAMENELKRREEALKQAVETRNEVDEEPSRGREGYEEHHAIAERERGSGENNVDIAQAVQGRAGRCAC